ncbi:MAG: phosphonopyruvate decarboxylase [Clostridiales bacterium]|nr:phosphonopyruvate decarboxylase [Clostridiales bacterium]
MKTSSFLEGMAELGVDFYAGVPDSLLKLLGDAIYEKYGDRGRHVVAANEGNAVALCAGHYIATGRPGLCYMQNSGIGNAVNPIASLLNDRVYGIPCIFVVGWRGEPEIKDEPQHAFQGTVTRELLELMDLKVFPLNQDTGEEDFAITLPQVKDALAAGKSVAYLVSQGGLSDGPKVRFECTRTLKREEALREILRDSTDRDIYVSTTGKTSREVFELREALHQDHSHDFLTVGSMGHASMIALGIAMEKPDFTIWCLDGDGAALMHLGSLAVEARQRVQNLVHVLLNNGAHESVGGMPVSCGNLSFAPIAQAVGFDRCLIAQTIPQLHSQLALVRKPGQTGLRFLEILLAQGSRPDLGRPTLTPKQNLRGLMHTLKNHKQMELVR